MTAAGPIKINTALVVDDTRFAREVVGTTLTQIGVDDVRTARDGKDALQQLDVFDPDVLVLDLMMPEMDGIQFLSRLADRRYTGGVVLVSGVERSVITSAENLARERGINVLGTLSKPYTVTKLKEVVRFYKGRIEPEDLELRVTADDLRRALRDDEIQVYVQPKITVATRSVVGAEALARWVTADGQVLLPGEFIPLAEEVNLIDALTETVLARSLDACRMWQRHKLRMPIAINLSAVSLNNLDLRTWDLPEHLVKEAGRRGIFAEDVTVELTESRLMSDLTSPREILTRMRLKGIKLSIDDFGTGYSSLKQLKTVPFSELKIDRSFVTGANRDDAARAVLESSVDIARRFDLVTVAEGIETEEDLEICEKLGVDIAQGFFIARPMPAENLPEWVSEWNSRQVSPS